MPTWPSTRPRAATRAPGSGTSRSCTPRWSSAWRSGLLSPFHFIEVAEESGAIVAIGMSVLREALDQFARWKAGDPSSSLTYVSVNVSARQFRTPGFVDHVHEAIADAGARPEWLLLE